MTVRKCGGVKYLGGNLRARPSNLLPQSSALRVHPSKLGPWNSSALEVSNYEVSTLGVTAYEVLTLGVSFLGVLAYEVSTPGVLTDRVSTFGL